MTTSSDFVLIQKDLFDDLRRHCEHCHGFDGSLEDLPDGRVVLVPSRRPGPIPLKRKSSMGPPKKALHKRLPPVEAALSWFLRHTPKAPDWRARQIELGLKTVEQYEGVIRAFGNVADIGIEASYGDAKSKDELVNLAERLALLTKRSLANAKLQRSFAYFQVLILLSCCQVLQKQHVPFREIDRIVGHIVPMRKTARRC